MEILHHSISGSGQFEDSSPSKSSLDSSAESSIPFVSGIVNAPGDPPKEEQRDEILDISGSEHVDVLYPKETHSREFIDNESSVVLNERTHELEE